MILSRTKVKNQVSVSNPTGRERNLGPDGIWTVYKDIGPSTTFGRRSQTLCKYRYTSLSVFYIS